MLSWNEIKARALKFSLDWKDETSEDAEAKTFVDEFFNIFGVNRRRLAQFEKSVEKLNKKKGFMDLFWEGVLLIEMKSRGKSLDKAYEQALDYFVGLKDEQLPKYILTSDFEYMHLYNLESENKHIPLKIKVENLADDIESFGFIAGYQRREYKEQDPVNIEAAEKMGRLHDKLKAVGYSGHKLELYLVRLLFCLFAEDTGIFEKNAFADFVRYKTSENGKNTAAMLGNLFEILNTPIHERMQNIDEDLQSMPYINGKLFAEHLPTAGFDADMRNLLLEAAYLDWGKISPAIFGSLFQSVMDEEARRNMGAHYTSEKNILKVISPLFLDKLKQEFEDVKTNKNKLYALQEKISKMKFLDPACGCGNFLIVAYRELRKLELDIVMAIRPPNDQRVLDVDGLLKVNVGQFYGIEYEEFAAQIAQVAMWLVDHQMNMEISKKYGEYYVRLPLVKSASIVHGNALKQNWETLLGLPEEIEYLTAVYILGNPPFIGKHYQSKEQKQDMSMVLGGIKAYGNMDYVSCWFYMASEMMYKCYQINPDFDMQAAFVSTNSITQGEQVGTLWGALADKFNNKISFAHRTFKWGNEAKGNAAVHVVIVGFGCKEQKAKKIYDYIDNKGDPVEIQAANINGYLVAASDVYATSRSKPISDVPVMVYGNKPVDGGHFMFTAAEKAEFVKKEPASEKYFKKIMGSREFIQNIERYCLWLVDIDPSEIKRMPMVLDRIQKVKEMRLNSVDKGAQELAMRAREFRDIRNPNSYLAIPETSSENRTYIPMAFLDARVIASNALQTIPEASVYVFGVLTSIMHMTWVKYVCGRLKSDYRYSGTVVYNNFPFPLNPSPKHRQAVEEAAQAVLDARALYPTASLADLYDANSMPVPLVKAHHTLDKAVDACYGKPLSGKPFDTEAQRMEFLFALYQQYTQGFMAPSKPKRAKK